MPKRLFDNRFLSTVGAGCILLAACAFLFGARTDVRQVIRATIAGGDEVYNADVERISGKNRLLTTTTIASVNIPNGQDPLPDSYYTIVDTGASGGTWTTSIKGTLNDPSSPDRDVADVDVDVSVTVTEAGDELELRDKIVTTFNADAGAQAAYLKANAVKDRAIVHITSTKYSLPGEFYERGTALDFAVTPPTDGVVVVAYDKLESRAKPTSLGRDPDNPHNLGVQAISGTVFSRPAEVPRQIEANLENATYGEDMAQNGSVTPISYRLNCDPDFNLNILEIRVWMAGNGIKLGQYGSINSCLTNGVELNIRSNNELASALDEPMKCTEDLMKHLSVPIRNFGLYKQSGFDNAVGAREYANPFVINKCGTFPTNDYVEAVVNDDLSSLGGHEVIVIGFKSEP